MTFKTKTAAGRIAGKIRQALVSGLVLAASAASAGYVTTNETALDLIYSQAAFGSSTIDIRFNATLSFNAPTLTAFDSDTEWNQLSAFANPDTTVVSMFFVDSISSCSGTFSGIVGCGAQPGNLLVLSSSWAADAVIGPVLAGHELGHNLGLAHLESSGNLMNGSLTGNSTLLPAQVAAILASPLVHTDAFGQRYITITPIALVPEPGAWLLMGLGLFGLLLRSRVSRG